MECFFMLLIIYFIYLCYALFISKFDIVSPSVIFFSSFFSMLSLAYYYKDKLGFNVEYRTFYVLTIAGLIFLLTESLIKRIKENNTRKIINCDCFDNENIVLIKEVILKLSIIFLLFSIIVSIIVIYVNTKNIVNVEWNMRMTEYRELLLSGRVQYYFFISQLYKINTAIAYIYTYIFTYNLVVDRNFWRKQGLIIAFVIGYIILASLYLGGRQPTVELILSTMVMYIILLGDNRFKVLKFVMKCVPILFLLGILFYFSADLIGRADPDRDILEYLATYFCGGLYSFNLHIDNPAYTEVWGQSSFSEIYKYLIKFKFLDASIEDMSYHSFEIYGNTVTIFGRWYEDFGSLGVYIMTAIVAASFSWLYYFKVKNTAKGNRLADILYAKLVMALILAGYDDRVRDLISVHSFFICLLICIIYYGYNKYNVFYRIGVVK